MTVNKKGQVILIVLLASAVILTIGLAVTSRTITDLTVTTQEQEYTRSFDAAEAGIEDLLGYQGGLPALVGLSGLVLTPTPVSIGDIEYSYTLTEEGNAAVYGPTDGVENGNVFQLNLEDFGGNAITVNWTGEAAVEFIFVYNDGSTTLHKILAGDNDCLEGIYENISTTCSHHDRCYTIDETDIPSIFNLSLKFLRVKPLCEPSTKFTFEASGGQFPPQSYKAHVESRSGENVSAVEVKQTADRYLPGIFDYALFSGQSIEITE